MRNERSVAWAGVPEVLGFGQRFVLDTSVTLSFVWE